MLAALLLGFAWPLQGQQPQSALADSLWAAGQHDAAAAIYAQRLAADSNDVTALRRLATLRAWGGKYEEAIRLYDRALRAAPADRELALERARILAWDRQYARAIEGVTAVLGADPTNRAAIEALAQFTSWSGRYDESLAAYGRLIQASPGDVKLQAARARVLGWSRQYDRSAAAFEEILRRTPEDRDARLGLAQVLSWGGRYDSAAVIFTTMLRADPRDVDALKGLARIATWSGNLREGERRWRELVAIVPKDVEVLVGIGANLRVQGREAAAMRFLEAAEQVEPTNADLRVQLQYARAALAPRIAPSHTYEDDTDHNVMRTTSLLVAGRPRPALELRATGYRRQLAGFGLAGIALRSTSPWGVQGGASLALEPGWVLSGAAGVAEAGGASRATGRLALASPRRDPLSWSVSAARALFDVTAALADRGVYTDQLAAEGSWRASARTTATLSGAATRFVGTEGNLQLLGSASAMRRLAGPFSVGAAVRAFTFEKDREALQDGYFNPSSYGMIEAIGSVYRELGRWAVSAEAAPGVQRIGGETTNGSLRLNGRLTWSPVPGRQLGLSAAFANSGLNQLSSSGTADYRYRAIGAFSTWSF